MRTAVLLLTGLLAVVLVAGGTLCPQDTDNCVASLMHVFVVIGIGGALSISLIPQTYLRPVRLVAYKSYCPDPAAPPPRG